MTIQAVREIWQGRGADSDTKAFRSYTRTFIVTTDSTLDDGPTIIATMQTLYPLFSPYVGPAGSFDLYSVLNKISPKQRADSPYVWDVALEYSTRTGDSSRYQQNPTDRPAEARWSIETFQKAIDQDLDGKAIVNSAFEKFDPPVEIDEGRLTLSYSRDEASYDPGLALAYANTVNSDTFLGFPPKTAKCTGIEADLKSEAGQYFYKVSYSFHFRLETWDKKVLDQGFHTFSGAAAKPTVVKDTANVPLSAASLLDGTGRVLINTVWDGSTNILSTAGYSTTLASNNPLFLASMLNMSFQIRGGTNFIPGFYNVAAFTDTTHIVLDRVPVTVAGAGSGGSGNMAPVYMTFHVYNAVPFAPLNITLF